jgi:hypothetical protein
MYEIIDSDKTDTLGLRISAGEFEGTVFRFLNIAASEDAEEDEGLISYSFEILEGEQGLRENEDFHTRMGEILHELIMEAIDKQFPEGL